MMIRLPAASGLPKPCGVDRLPAAGRPGAEPRRVVELRRCRAARCRRSRSSPRPASAASSCLGVGDLVGRHREEDHVVHDVGVARQHERPGEERVLGQLRVEQEAAVVVGADAVGGRRACTTLGHPQRHRVSPARSGLGLLASTRGVVGLVGRVSVAVSLAEAESLGSACPRWRCRPAGVRGGVAAGAAAASEPRRAGADRGQRPAVATGLIPVARSSPDRRARAGARGRQSGGTGAGVEHEPVARPDPPARRLAGQPRTAPPRSRAHASASAAAFGVVGARDRRATWVGACGLRSRNASVVVGLVRRRRPGCRPRRSCRTGSPGPRSCGHAPTMPVPCTLGTRRV